ncbi:MAG: lipase [Nitrosomonas sp.]|nr:lipase [Nitrosomonas sp.]MCW5607739.1 lipase [Nitrosomonas sp.]
MCCFLLNPGIIYADKVECAEQAAFAAFLEESSLLCLQKIAIKESPGSEFYKASLQWSGPDKPDEFRLLNVEGDLAGGTGSPVFSTENGTLILSKVDIPKIFGTERYVAYLTLADQSDLSIFKLTSVTVYINPDYVPQVTWKPYGMLATDERYAVDVLGRSIPFARLADAVYDFDNTIVDQWVLIDTKDKSSGMQAAVYSNEETGELTLAFRGTETCDIPCSLRETAEFLRDAAADGMLSLGLVHGQFKDAVRYTQDVIDNLAQGRKIIVTGHSLGGGLAQAVGAAFGLETYAFNSAPVPDDFFKKYPPVLPAEILNEMMHVIADIHDPVSNTDETGKFYVNASHASVLLQFDFDSKEVLPVERKKLDDLRFNRHSMTRLLENAVSLLSIYQDGW